MSATFYEKNQISRYSALLSILAQNKIQGMAGAVLGEKGGGLYISDGNHRVPNVNRNSDDDFKLNLDNFENDWNDDNCILVFCDLFNFSRYLLAGVFSWIFFFQPPSIRPTASTRSISEL